MRGGGLLKNSEAGCGQMLDHFLVCGGLDALLARITPSSGLECSAQKLGELLRAFEIVCDRAAPTTAPHFALSYARHLQRGPRETKEAGVVGDHKTIYRWSLGRRREDRDLRPAGALFGAIGSTRRLAEINQWVRLSS